MSVVSNNILAGASGQGGGGYEIERSLRFNSADSAYLNRTPSSAGNRKTWTWSGWVKRSGIGANDNLFKVSGSATKATQFSFMIHNGNYVSIDYGGAFYLQTNRLLRDPSAWMHLVVAVDTTTSTANNRIRLYINGTEETSFATRNNPNQDEDLAINTTSAHTISTGDASGLDGYMADIHFIDGQALAPTDFGEFDDNGVWQPKEFDGTYTLPASGTTTALSQTGWNPPQEGNIWDGSTSTQASGHNGGVIGSVSFNPPLTNVTKVELYTQNYNHYLNGSQISTSQSSTGWHTYYDNSSSPITLNSVGNAYTNNTQTVDLMAIRINGTIVNAQTWTPPSGVGLASSGANSFHLPFTDNSSNAALGTDTSGNSNTWTVNNLIANRESKTIDTIASVADITSAYNMTTNVRTRDVAAFTGATISVDAGYAKINAENGGLITGTCYPALNGTIIFYTINSGSHRIILYYGDGTSSTVANGAGSSSSYTEVWQYNVGTHSDVVSYSVQETGNNNDTIFCGINVNGSDLVHGQVVGSTLTFLTSNNFYKASVGDVVQTSYEITAIDASNNTVSVNGGSWYGTNGSGTSGGDTVLTITAVTNGDNFVDTPTNGTQTDTGAGGEITGNYAVLNPIEYYGGTTTFTNGSLEVAITSASSSGPYPAVRPTINPFNQGDSKLYAEVTIGSKTSSYQSVGANTQAHNMTGSGDIFVIWRSDGLITESGVSATRTGTGVSYTTGDVIGVAYDNSTQALKFYKNNSLVVTWTFTSIPDKFNIFCGTDSTTGTGNFTWNFGQRAFSYPLSGYKALCTSSLPTPTIADGSKYFDTKLWTGTNTNAANTISGYKFSPDLVWAKSRSNAYNHQLIDTVRGGNKSLASNGTTAEVTNEQYGYIDTFNSDGFTTTPGTGDNDYFNGTGKTYVGWAWDAGSSNTTIAAGGLNSATYDQSEVWSNGFTVAPSGGASQALRPFNGEFTGTGGYQAGYWNTTCVWKPATAISYTSSVEIWDDIGDQQWRLNETGSYTTIAATGVWVTAATGSGTLTAVEIQRPSNTSQVHSFKGLRVDGKILVDSTATPPNVPSIASTIRANPSAGFSIVSWTGTGSAATIGHGLNAAPSMLIQKFRSATSSWGVFHKSLSSGTRLTLNTTDAATSSGGSYVNVGSSTFDVHSGNNDSGVDMIAYCFAPVEGYSAMGSYTGNGSADGPFVYTGFKPKWVMYKRTDVGNSWQIQDTSRDPDNPVLQRLIADASDAEYTGTSTSDTFDALSNGFKIRGLNNAINASGGTFIYIAFAENPFKTARAR